KYGGPQHFLVTLTATAEAQPKLLKISYAMPLAKFLCEGELSAAGKPAWTFRATWVEQGEDGKEAPKSHEDAAPAPPDLLSDYLLVPISPFLPRKQGECFHFTNLNPATGEVAAPSGLLVAAQEDVDLGGTKVKAWRIDQCAWGQVARSTYVSEDGRVVKNVYGPGVESYLTDKLKALANLPPVIKPASR
ncbi:MAG: hypothetical protein KIS92_07250, partial [Planctomycetota bacterium]|nr:hypothetical protein [Planctomycetota bacterium]